MDVMIVIALNIIGLIAMAIWAPIWLLAYLLIGLGYMLFGWIHGHIDWLIRREYTLLNFFIAAVCLLLFWPSDMFIWREG